MRMTRPSRFILCACLMMLLSGMALHPAWAARAVKTDIQSAQGVEQVIIRFDQPVKPLKHFMLSNPERLVIDLPALTSGAGVGMSPNYKGALLRAVRYGKPEPGISRIVLDLGAKIMPPQINHSLNPPQLVIGLTQDGSAAPLPLGAPLTTSAPTPAEKPKVIAQQAARPLIVIDAGHGGKDSGAIGPSGFQEKNITLEYAIALRDVLQESGRYRVALTRSDDSYLFLKDRVQVAREQKADMFISLHADSNPNADARGLSVYTLSEKASDEETAALAAQENRADVIGGIDLAVEDKQVADILLDLAQRETRNKGSEFAELIIANMHTKVPLLTNSHRFAGFRVLKAPDIPSVLVEAGFLSNKEDESRLRSREYKDKVARSILAAIDAYWDGKDKNRN